MDWDEIRYFLAVSQSASIRGAALKLEVNHSTVSRKIAQLEKKLGVRLFDKLPTGYIITPAGEEIVHFAQQMEQQSNALERKVVGRDAELSGTLRVTLQEAIATHLLMDDFKQFAELYPGIILELVVSDEDFSLSKREADVAIRITNNRPQEHLVGRKVLSYYTCVYATPDYIQQHVLSELEPSANWIGWDDLMPFPLWVKNSAYPNFQVQHQMGHLMSQLAGAKAGLGISMLPCFIADVEPTLQRLPDAKIKPGRDIWLLTHRDLRQTARVRVFTNYMADAIRNYEDLLEGRGVF